MKHLHHIVPKHMGGSDSSEEIRHKKRISDPRSTKIVIDDVIYDSIRHAAKNSGISYSQIRKMIKEGLLKTL